MFFVSGLTGKVGGEAGRQLLAAGRAVRTLALRQAPPPRLVVLSSVGSQQTRGLGLITSTHLLEEALGDLPFPTLFLRAGSFLENYGYGLQAAAATGWFDTYLTPTDRPSR